MSKKNNILNILISPFIGVALAFLIFRIPYVYIEPEIAPKFKYIESLIKQNCNSYNFPSQYSIKFGNLYDDIVGLCEKRVFKWNIKIDPKAWSTFSEAQKTALIFHEVLHCALDLEHNDKKIGIMNSFIPGDITFEEIYIELNNIIRECKNI